MRTKLLAILTPLILPTACATPGADRKLQEHYLRGDFVNARAVVDREGYGGRRVATASQTPPSPADTADTHFLDAMNRGMFGLGLADSELARLHLEHGSVHLRHLLLGKSNLAEGVAKDLASMLGDDYALTYTVMPFELTIAECVLGLAHALRADIAERTNGLDQARNYARDGASRTIAAWANEYFTDQETRQSLGLQYDVQHTHTGLAHFLQASLIEHLDRAEANKLYAEAMQIEQLPGVAAQLDRGGPPGDLRSVWIYVVEGPGAARIRQDSKAGASIETLARFFYALAGGARDRDLGRLIPDTSFPVPARSFIDTGVRGVTVRVGDEPDDYLVPVIADVARAARENFAIERDVRLARQIVRRLVKETGAAVVAHNANSLISNLTGISTAASKIMERADLRTWATMPSRVRALRLDLPPGVHRIELNVEASGAPVKIAGEALRGDATPRAVLVTRRSIEVDVPHGSLPTFVVAVVPSALAIGEVATSCPVVGGQSASVVAKP